MAEKQVTLIYEPFEGALFFAPLAKGDSIQVPESEVSDYLAKGIWKEQKPAAKAKAKAAETTEGGE